MILPLVIGALAIGITLLYASKLDIKERRIPSEKWVPMLIISLPLAVFTFYSLDRNSSLLLGYLALIGTILYALYIEGTNWERRLRFYVLTGIAMLFAGSWLFSSLDPILILVYVPIVIILIILALLGGDDNQKIPVLKRLNDWYLIFILPLFALGSIYTYIRGSWGILGFYLGLVALFCLVFFLFGYLNLFGGADAWALILISVSIPLFPMEPFLGLPPIQFFPYSVFINAVILNIVAPLGVFVLNLAKGNRAPFRYLFLGFPVPGDRIEQYFGFVMEDIQEQDGSIVRRFLPLRQLLGRMFRGENRKYTKDLRLEPEKYKKEREIYRKAGKVWIVYGVPFIVPITAGFFSALIMGDIFYYLMQLVVGV